MNRIACMLAGVLAGFATAAFAQTATTRPNSTSLPFVVPAVIPDRQHAQSPDQIHLAGMLGSRIEKNAINRLAEVDIDRLLEGYRTRPGRQTWDGEHIGKWLHAATLAWIGLEGAQKTRLRLKLDAAVAELLKCQEASGYLGTYLPANRWKEWDVWAHKYNLIGLLTYIQQTGNRQPLEACRRMADLLIEEFGEGPGGQKPRREILTSGAHNGMASTSLLEPMVLLYRLTGDERYRSFAQFLFTSWERPLGPHIVSRLLRDRRVDRVGNGKAYEMLSCLNGMLEWYRLTGDPQLLQAARIAWQDIVDKRLYITGTASAREHFRADFDLPNIDNVGETCVTVTWVQFNAHLLRLTGEAPFADELEKTLYNQLPGAQRPDGRAWGYYIQMAGTKPYRDSFDGHCCLSSGPRGIALIPTLATTTDADGVVFNLYETGWARLELQDGTKVRLDTRTPYPTGGAVSITVSPAAPATFALKLRIPPWAAQAARITLNNAPAGAPGADGYRIIRRLWHPGEIVHIELPVGLRMIAGDHGNEGKVAFAWGPLILAYDAALNNRSSALPAAVLKTVAYQAEAQPALGLHKDWPEARVFSLRQADARDMTLAPFATAGASGGRYRVWLGGLDASLPESLLAWGTESRSRQGNLEGSILEGETVVTFDGRKATDDWYAVTLPEAVTVRRIVFAHGRVFHDGGWFDTSGGKPRVQAKVQSPDGRSPATAWVTVGILNDYPDATATTPPPGLKEGARFTCTLPTAQKVLAVRVIGTPACGDSPAQAFSSCAGLFAMSQ